MPCQQSPERQICWVVDAKVVVLLVYTVNSDAVRGVVLMFLLMKLLYRRRFDSVYSDSR